MILPVHQALRARLRDVLAAEYGLQPEALASAAIEYPPNRSLGDLALPVAFELARRLRKAPKAIAQELAAKLPPVRGIARIDAAPNGNRLFVALRGPVPLSGDPHNARGTTPGLGIIQVTEGGRDGRLLARVPLTNAQQQPGQAPDAHGLRVRLRR